MRHVSIKVTSILQILGVLIVFFTMLLPDSAVPEQWKAVVVIVVAVLKALQAALQAQYSNPDGTAAQAPWNPKDK